MGTVITLVLAFLALEGLNAGIVFAVRASERRAGDAVAALWIERGESLKASCTDKDAALSRLEHTGTAERNRHAAEVATLRDTIVRQGGLLDAAGIQHPGLLLVRGNLAGGGAGGLSPVPAPSPDPTPHGDSRSEDTVPFRRNDP